MTRIQSSVGLITGIPIEETVNQLMEVAAQPRDMVTDRNKLLQAESVAIDKLSSLVLALQFEANKLKSTSLFNSRTATSSDTKTLTAAIASGKTPAAGKYLFTPVQTATAQQWMSQSISPTAALGEGSFTIRTGGFLNKGIGLDELNGGAGVTRGEIRITDRSGANSVIDLRFARTIDDVLTAINSDTTINVTAEAVGDTIRLTDNTGQTTSNLIVQEVNNGATAASLGISGINVAATTATGSDVLRLHAGTKLSSLNDGNGVQLRSGNDLAVTLKDGSTVNIDLGEASTLGDVLDAINVASPAKVSAAISGDGNRVVLTDLTAGGGQFAVANVGSGTAAKDLGLTVAASGSTITGRRLIAGLSDTLVSSLQGGKGLGTLGEVDITNRNNVSSTVNLAGAETLSEIVTRFNSQGVGITASINAARNGITLNDTTGASLSNFIVADGDANQTATALGLVVSQTSTTLNSGTLSRQIVSEATLLSSLNQGKGVKLGDLRITDSTGYAVAVDLNPTGNEAKTVGDVINAINDTNVGVEARINDTGDGIVLVDTAGGSGPMKVAELGGGRAAADLKLLGTSTTIDINGVPTKVIDGTSAVTITTDADDKLADLVAKINELGVGISASVINDGSGQRLSLNSTETGVANELLLDTTDSSLSLQQLSSARDGLLLYGSASSASQGILISSSSNTFANVVDGLNLTVVEGSEDPVTVTVAASNTSLTSTVEEFVKAFNSLATNIDDVTEFDAEALTTGILFGSTSVLRVEADINRVLSGRYFRVGDIKSLEAVGIKFTDKGQMELDKAKLQAAFADDPESVEKLFTDKEFGVVAKLTDAIKRLAGEDGSALNSRSNTLARRIEANDTRIELMNASLDRQRERLTMQFYQLESVVAQMQSSLDALANFTPIAPISTTSNSRR